MDQPRRAKAAAARAPARRSEPAPGAPPWIEAYVLVASFLVGGIVLVVEILGTRVVSPYYGASIYVWSSLIGVTLGALTIGYVLGGWAADRWPALTALVSEMIGGALFLVLVPWLRRAVLVATTPLGLKAGSLVSALLLFGPPLALLGMTGPSAIRLVTSDFTFLGRGVGKIYGVSTLGSMLGAILTGFVLIPSFAVSTLLIACAVVLLVVAGLGLAFARRPLAGAAAAVAAVLAAAGAVRAPLPRSNVLHIGNSFYGEIKVVDVQTNRVLLIDGVDNGFVDRVSFEGRAPYIADFDYLPFARPEAKRALCIGLGAGSVPRTFHLRGIATEVVEIDPEIVRLTRRYFGFPAEVPVIVEDGRTYVERTTERYDFVVLDAFHGETHPVHLFTREFFARVDAVLLPGGVLAINMAGLATGVESAAWRSVHRTLAERFAHVRVFAEVPPEGAATRFTNLFLVASQESLPTPIGSPALAKLARNEIQPDAAGDAVILTDDYNPIDDLQRSVLVAWRENVIRQAQPVLLLDGGS